MNFLNLLHHIQETHQWFSGQTARQINTALTLRNWLIGMYLHKDFYLSYPQILQSVIAQLQKSDNQNKISKSTLLLSLQDKVENTETGKTFHSPESLLERLTYTHFIELLKCDTAHQRAFYETEAMVNNWSVRELRRAMDSMLFERTGLSQDKQNVLEKYRVGSGLDPADIIRNPYVLEFLGLEEKPEFSETDLEQAIIEHLQKFLLEAGRGFCFEARQRRITFDNRHYRIDLVFYHRILKCHVLFDLKIGQFDHADAGQMNLYLNYYREKEMTAGDALPVGVILCAQKNQAMVHYATGGLPQQIFVSKYMINLPSEEELSQIVREEQEKLG